MEEVWNDISLSLSSIYTHHHSSAVDHHRHSLNFQDFLNSNTNNNEDNNNNNNTQVALSEHDPFSGGAPVTALRLGTGAPAKKRALFVDGCNEKEDSQERSKRLMKNRESADRSRARKQAYTMELEKEVERLKKENATLKGQLKMLSSEGHSQLPKRHSLHRTLTAPF